MQRYLKWFWPSLVFILILCVYLITQFGISPKAVRIIRPSAFDSPEHLGQVIYNQLRPRLRLHKYIVLGGEWSRPFYKRVYLGFSEEANRDKTPFTQALSSNRFIGEVKNWMPQVQELESAEWDDGDESVLVFVSAAEAYHKTQNGKILKLEEFSGQKMISLIMGQFRLGQPDPVDAAIGVCKYNEDQARYLFDLPCLFQQKSKLAFKYEKLPKDKIIAEVEQMGQLDFLVSIQFDKDQSDLLSDSSTGTYISWGSGLFSALK